MRTEEGGGAGSFGISNVFGGALGDDFSAGLTAFGTEIDEIVGFSEDIEVVFNHHDCVTGIDQAVEQVNQAADIGEVQPDGGLFQKEEVMGGPASPTAGLSLVG